MSINQLLSIVFKGVSHSILAEKKTEKRVDAYPTHTASFLDIVQLAITYVGNQHPAWNISSVKTDAQFMCKNFKASFVCNNRSSHCKTKRQQKNCEIKAEMSTMPNAKFVVAY